MDAVVLDRFIQYLTYPYDTKFEQDIPIETIGDAHPVPSPKATVQLIIGEFTMILQKIKQTSNECLIGPYGQYLVLALKKIHGTSHIQQWPIKMIIDNLLWSFWSIILNYIVQYEDFPELENEIVHKFCTIFEWNFFSDDISIIEPIYSGNGLTVAIPPERKHRIGKLYYKYAIQPRARNIWDGGHHLIVSRCACIFSPNIPEPDTGPLSKAEPEGKQAHEEALALEMTIKKAIFRLFTDLSSSNYIILDIIVENNPKFRLSISDPEFIQIIQRMNRTQYSNTFISSLLRQTIRTIMASNDKAWDLPIVLHLLEISNGGLIDIISPFINWKSDGQAIVQWVRGPRAQHDDPTPLKVLDFALMNGIDVLDICYSIKPSNNAIDVIEIRHYLRRRRLALRVLARGLLPLLGSSSPVFLLSGTHLAREIFLRLY
jgi:hypothetical protein